MKSRLTSFILLLALSVFAAAAAPKFTVLNPGKIRVGDKFAVTYRLDNAEGTDFHAIPISGCRLLNGPSVMTGSSYEMVNGQTTRSTRIEYTYYYLAEKEGRFTIPAASITVGGRKMTTRPLVINVTSGAQTPASQRPTSIDDFDTQSSDRPVNPSDVFVRINLSRSSAWEQQAIECTIKLYTSYYIDRFIPTKEPSFDGFLIQEVEAPQALNAQESLNGRSYLTAVLRKYILFPQKSGKLTITSGDYDVIVTQIETITLSGFATVRQPRQRQIRISSNTASVDVRALPSPPEGFSGAVGNFSVSSRLVGSSLRTNEASTLIYTIRGTGNIKYIKEPDLEFPADFELYAPSQNVEAQVSGGNISGTMTIDYTFVPRKTGDFVIPGHRFIYFDPEKAEYVTLTTPKYPVNVTRGTGQTGEEVQTNATDIRDIVPHRTTPALSHPTALDSVAFWVLFALLPLALCTLLLWRRHNMRLHADEAGLRRARAGKVAAKRLAKARSLVSKPDEFYQEALTALQGYLGDRLSLPPSQLARATVNEGLERLGVPEELRRHTEEMLDRCEMARYTPGASEGSAVGRTLDELTALINSLEETTR